MVWQDVFAGSGPRIDAEYESELRLSEQARAGAEWALAALVARYQPVVTRYLTRLTGDASLTPLLAEQTFVRMEQRLHGPHGGQQLRLWLLRSSTEAGLEVLRKPPKAASRRLAEPRRPVGLLPGNDTTPVEKRRFGLSKLAQTAGTTSRQLRGMIWSTLTDIRPAHQPPRLQPATDRSNEYRATDTRDPRDTTIDEDPFTSAPATSLDENTTDPRTELRYRLTRAILAELPYGDAQCLALHLIAGLNQAEVARALGITPSATRKRIVQGLKLFAQRYEAAIASLNLPADFFAESEQNPFAPELSALESDQFLESDTPYAEELPAYASPGSSGSQRRISDVSGELKEAQPASVSSSRLSRIPPPPIIVDADIVDAEPTHAVGFPVAQPAMWNESPPTNVDERWDETIPDARQPEIAIHAIPAYDDTTDLSDSEWHGDGSTANYPNATRTDTAVETRHAEPVADDGAIALPVPPATELRLRWSDPEAPSHPHAYLTLEPINPPTQPQAQHTMQTTPTLIALAQPEPQPASATYSPIDMVAGEHPANASRQEPRVIPILSATPSPTMTKSPDAEKREQVEGVQTPLSGASAEQHRAPLIPVLTPTALPMSDRNEPKLVPILTPPPTSLIKSSAQLSQQERSMLESLRARRDLALTDQARESVATANSDDAIDTTLAHLTTEELTHIEPPPMERANTEPEGFER